MKLKFILTSTALALLTGLAMVACEEQDMDRTFEGPYFVRFTDTTLTYKESYNQVVPIRVHNVGPLLNEPITITYTVSGSAREGKDYSIAGTKGTVTIPANESFGEIQLKLINNANNILESQNLVFTLTGVEPANLQVGFGKDGILGKSMTFVIQDDCLLGGTYTGNLRVGNQTASARDIAITSTDCKTYTVANWNIGLFNFEAIKASLTFVDNGDNSLTIPLQSSPELAAPYDTISGTGSWNPQNRQLLLNLRVKLPVSETKDSVYTFPITYVPQ